MQIDIKRSLRRGAALAALVVMAGLPLGASAKPPGAVQPSDSIAGPAFGDMRSVTPAADLTLKIKKVNCHDGHVAVKIRLQNLNTGPVVAPITTTVKVGGETASTTFPSSPQNPWWNAQEIGFNLFPGAGTHAVSATVDPANAIAETQESNNDAPSASNSYDSNPSPLHVVCEGNSLQKLPQDALRPVRRVGRR